MDKRNLFHRDSQGKPYTRGMDAPFSVGSEERIERKKRKKGRRLLLRLRLRLSLRRRTRSLENLHHKRWMAGTLSTRCMVCETKPVVNPGQDLEESPRRSSSTSSVKRIPRSTISSDIRKSSASRMPTSL